MTELAPEACIVCGAQKELVPGAPNTWLYLANVEPLGSLACSTACAVVAIRNVRDTGRTDGKVKR